MQIKLVKFFILAFLSLISISNSQIIPKASMMLKAYNSLLIGKFITDENSFTLYTFQTDSLTTVPSKLDDFTAYYVTEKDSVKKDSEISGEIGYLKINSNYHVTLNGWALYYSNDELKGNLTNQTLSQSKIKNSRYWFVISPNGKLNYQYRTKWEVSNKGDLNLSENSLYGSPHLTDKDGVVLYIFDQDEFLKSNCDGECLSDWPPYIPNDGEKYFDENGYSMNSPSLKVGEGIDPSLISVAKGTSNGKPIYLYAYNGWPLYYYKNEKTPGTAKCQAIFMNDGWWLLLLKDGNVNIESNSKSSTPNVVVSYSEGFRLKLDLNGSMSSFLKTSIFLFLTFVLLIFV